MKILLLLSLLLVGCSDKQSDSKEYIEFVKANKGEFVLYCEDGFQMQERFIYRNAKAPQVFLINSQDCKGKKNDRND